MSGRADHRLSAVRFESPKVRRIYTWQRLKLRCELGAQAGLKLLVGQGRLAREIIALHVQSCATVFRTKHSASWAVLEMSKPGRLVLIQLLRRRAQSR